MAGGTGFPTGGNSALLALDFLGVIVSAVSNAIRRGVKPQELVVHIDGLRAKVDAVDSGVDGEADSHAG